MTRLTDLSPEQIRLMVKLNEDSLPLVELSADEDEELGALIGHGLATLDEADGGQIRGKLTERGQRVREEGEW